MSFFKKILQASTILLLSMLNVVVEKVSTALMFVTISEQRPVTLKELMISKYNDFKLFIHKSVYRRINDKQSSKAACEQNEFLKFFIAKIHQLPFMRGIKQNVAQKNVAEMISIRHYLTGGKGANSNFSYHIDKCGLNVLDKNKDIEKNI